jgi:cytochrome P450 family 135
MLPPGPDAHPLLQTVAFHRDPLGALTRARSRYGAVFSLRLAIAGPLVVVADPGELERLLEADPECAHAGEARRRILPMASPRSIFGGDEQQHHHARRGIAPAFSPEAVDERRSGIAGIADAHLRRWPRGRPFRLLPRMRALLDDVFVRLVLGVRDERRARALVNAIGRMLWTPGNPPLPIPGEGDGALGAAATAFFERRHRPVSRLLVEEINARSGDHGGTSDSIAAALARGEEESPQALAEQLTVVLMAAQEPPASALTWLLGRLSREPELAEQFAAQPRDPLSDATVRESLRLRPPAIGALRRLTSTLRLGGHDLPAGTVTMIPIPLVQRDPRLFPEPNRFRPERWTSEQANETGYLPFGGGARRCIGEHLANSYIDTVVPTILRALRMRTVWPGEERAVLRGTILVPHRGGLMIAREARAL